MSHNNRKRVPCANRCGNVTRSTSGECRDCLLKPREAPAESFPPEQQGAWTEAGKERRKAELDRRRQQLAPLSLDATAEIVTALIDGEDAAVMAHLVRVHGLDLASARAFWDALSPAGRDDWLWVHEPRLTALPTLPQPEPVSAPPAPTSQAGDTLAVTEYREQTKRVPLWRRIARLAWHPSTLIVGGVAAIFHSLPMTGGLFMGWLLHMDKEERNESLAMFVLWYTAAWAAVVCVVAVCLQAMGVVP